MLIQVLLYVYILRLFSLIEGTFKVTCLNQKTFHMSEPPAKRSRVKEIIFSSWERHRIFKRVYGEQEQLSEENELFTKNSEELEMEPGSYKYSNYCSKLVLLEKDKIKKIFIGKFGDEVLKPSHLSNIINKLGVSLMLDLINNRLTYEQSVKAARVIENVLGDKRKKIAKVFDALNIKVDHISSRKFRWLNSRPKSNDQICSISS